jgi:hypothetical protein
LVVDLKEIAANKTFGIHLLPIPRNTDTYNPSDTARLEWEIIGAATDTPRIMQN